MTTQHHPELTARAIILGLVLGSGLAIGNVYMGLKTGWWDGGAIVAAIAGFTLLKAVRQSPSLLETNLLQTTAASTAAMASTTGLLGAIPALSLAGTRVGAIPLALWGICLGVIGVMLGLAYRQWLVEEEKLAFPSGEAPATVIRALHASETGAKGAAKALFSSLAISGAIAWFRDGTPKLIPGLTWLPMKVMGLPAETLTLGLTWSPLLLGAGGLVGLHSALSILFGALVAWAGLAPWIIHNQIVPNSEFTQLAGWLTWPGVGLMLGGVLVPLFRQTGAVFRIGMRRAREGTPSTRVPSYLWILILAAVIGTVVLARVIFELNLLQALIALVLAIFMTAVCARTAGQTDIGPFGSVGQLTQASFGVLAPGLVAANVGAASIVSGSAAQATQALWSYRAGYLLRASLRPLVVGQLLGVVVGACVVGPVYDLLVRVYGLGNDALPAPYGVAWGELARGFSRGADSLPTGAAIAALVAAGLALVVSFLPPSWERRLPALSAMGVGFIIPAHFSTAIALGAVLGLLIQRGNKQDDSSQGKPIAAGAIAGESLVGVAVAALLALGIL